MKVDDTTVNAYEQLKLIEVARASEKIVDSQFQNCGGLGAYGLVGLFWSPNSRYFYYTNAREGVPDGCGHWERPVVRLDVVNREIKNLGGGPISPDRTKLATWQGQELVIWDINRGEISRAPAISPTANTGPIAWSPDGTALVYLQTKGDCYPLGRTYLVHFDLDKHKQVLLFSSENPSFGAVIWDAPGQLRLFDENNKEWRYEFLTRQLTPPP